MTHTTQPTDQIKLRAKHHQHPPNHYTSQWSTLLTGATFVLLVCEQTLTCHARLTPPSALHHPSLPQHPNNLVSFQGPRSISRSSLEAGIKELPLEGRRILKLLPGFVDDVSTPDHEEQVNPTHTQTLPARFVRRAILSTSDAPPPVTAPPAASSARLSPVGITVVVIIVLLGLCILGFGFLLCWQRFRAGRGRVGSGSMNSRQGESAKAKGSGDTGEVSVLRKSASKSPKSRSPKPTSGKSTPDKLKAKGTPKSGDEISPRERRKGGGRKGGGEREKRSPWNEGKKSGIQTEVGTSRERSPNTDRSTNRSPQTRESTDDAQLKSSDFVSLSVNVTNARAEDGDKASRDGKGGVSLEEGGDYPGTIGSPRLDVVSGPHSPMTPGASDRRRTPRQSPRRLRQVLEDADLSIEAEESPFPRYPEPGLSRTGGSGRQPVEDPEEGGSSNWLSLKLQIEEFDCTPGADGMAKDIFMNRECFSIPSGKRVLRVSESGSFEFGTAETETERSSDSGSGRGSMSNAQRGKGREES